MGDSDLPLSGARVIEFTHMVRGPTCAMIFAGLGAPAKVAHELRHEDANRLATGADDCLRKGALYRTDLQSVG
jgi:crotonobetainyl-CoA:carnitine CoA-transferase CaiB-like acyl-CoA transferase